MVNLFQGLISVLANILLNKLSITLNLIGNLTHIHPYVYTSISCGGIKQTMVRVRIRVRVRVRVWD
jgi:hypothetical protein